MCTRQSGIKKIICVVLACFFGVSCCSCVGLYDWSYNLPNGYQVIRVNSESIVLSKNDSSGTVLDRYIVAFCHDGQYIGIKRAPMDNIEPNSHFDLDDINGFDLEYYLIDSQNDEKNGPFNEEEYLKFCENIDNLKMSDWINTRDFEGKMYLYDEINR